jgi:hypothetical protein
VRNTLHQPGEDLFAISRLTVTADTTPTDVSAWLAGTAGVKPVGEALQTKGWRAYRRGCAVLRRAPGNVYR